MRRVFIIHLGRLLQGMVILCGNAQRFMARLTSVEGKDAALDYAIKVFTQLSQPERLVLLTTVQTALDSGLYPCLGVVPNKVIIQVLLDRLLREMKRKKGVFEGVHGNKEEIADITSRIDDIKEHVAAVSVPTKELQISPRLTTFLETLDDKQYSDLIRFIVEMRDIKACRNSCYEAVHERYIECKLSEGGIANQFLCQIDRALIDEMAKMDFLELSMFVDYLTALRARKYAQGVVG